MNSPIFRVLFSLLATIFMCGLGETPASAQSSPTLFVFVPSSTNARALQSTLKEKLVGIEVLVLGRAKDLNKQLKLKPNAAVLAPVPVLELLGLKVRLQGTKSGKTSQAVVVVRMGGTGNVIGMLDLLGRKAMTNFASSLFGSSAASNLSVKRVRKSRDLRALLLLKQADAVLLSAKDANILVKALGSEASSTALSGPGVGLPSLGGGSDTSAVAKSLKTLPTSILKKMGIDGWK